MSGAGGAWLVDFLADTLVWSGALIVLVLALRGAVSRFFGPQIAYALWALPLLRLLLPPLVLPASMAPVLEQGAGEAVLVVAGQATGAGAPLASGFDLTSFALAIWLAGAAVLIGWRIAQYRAMRRALLADAKPVGEVGTVRLVETPATALPLAFGVLDKVVALPLGFMALPDRAARDLAIAHELAHHRGHDLIANLAAQVLLAAHWFNPVAWIGWQAMRKDQEAACDARVVAGRERAERAAYAEVIAAFAAGRPLAPHAPLACPILGEKSIIHRLRSLTLQETSRLRRRVGMGALVALGLALPLTTSISYAQPEAPEASPAPRIERRMVIVDHPSGAEIDDPSLHSQDVSLADGRVVTLRTAAPVSTEEALARVEAAMADMPEPPEPPEPPAPGEVRRFELRRTVGAPEPPVPPAPPAPPAERTERQVMLLDRSGDAATVDVRTQCTGEDCTVNVIGNSLAALERAREVVRTANLPEATRTEVLRALSREIEAMREGAEASYAVPPVELNRAVSRVSFRVLPPKPAPGAAVKPVPVPANVAERGAPLPHKTSFELTFVVDAG